MKITSLRLSSTMVLFIIITWLGSMNPHQRILKKKKKKKKKTGKQKPLKGYLRTNDLDTFQVSWTIPGFMDQSYIPTRNDL